MELSVLMVLQDRQVLPDLLVQLGHRVSKAYKVLQVQLEQRDLLVPQVQLVLMVMAT